MRRNSVFSLLVAVFGVIFMTNPAFAQEGGHEHGHDGKPSEETAHEPTKGEFNASHVIFGHIADAHEWHLFTSGDFHATMPLPVILYSKERGLSVFMSSKFGHEGHRESHDGYRLVDEGYKAELMARGIDPKIAEAFKDDKILDENAVNADGTLNEAVTVYDFSITKNVLSMIISVVLLLLIMTSVGRAAKRKGANQAPTGLQNAIEPLITFVRDEVARPSLGKKYARYMPLLLTVFFFIWMNNLLGLLPGGANFTGNIAVTACLAVISFLVMIFSGNKHFWGHLFNPPGVPLGIKFLLVPIEILSLFIKPIALMIRLFANILAGHIIILSIISMIFIFGAVSSVAGWGFVPVSMAFSVFMFCLELLVAAIQAFIFTNLTAVFIGQAIEEAHHHDIHTEDYHPHNPETGQEYNVGTKEIIA